MGTKANERQTPIALPPETIRELHRAALTLQPYVEREGRELTKGPMLGYVARWFLAQPLAEQLRITLDGKRIADAETPVDMADDDTLRRVAAEAKAGAKPKAKAKK
ncbi:ubiquitin family protein [Paludisphaera rhizosphaerae]|uniref:hypothetical protein n=1 Tax=Paludisphaera rhizosphaerae TaxID=2711216 RepID=UPI0013EDB275|nr:hypothetical protein [Paludisphaera rhizosphaerae]